MQFGILSVILFISELLVAVLGLQIPSTILGMILFLLLLYFKIIKIEWVEGISKVLIKYLPIFFIPTIVGVIEKTDLLRGNIVKLLIIILISTILILMSSSIVVDKLVKRRDDK